MFRANTAWAEGFDRIVVSLGDSYSSGEGNPPFYGQDGDITGDKRSDGDWLAHRSANSWPGQLVLDGTTLKDVRVVLGAFQRRVMSPGGWYFYASSGAVATNVYSSEQEKKTSDLEGRRTNSTTLAIQLEAAKEDLGDEANDVDYVTMTIGGNDMSFSEIVTKVALHNGFVDRDYLQNALNEVWYDYDESLPYETPYAKLFRSHYYRKHKGGVDKDGNQVELKRSQIATCYRRVRSAFGEGTQIIVAGYPTLMNEGKWDSYMESMGGANSPNPLERLTNRWRLVDWGASNVVGFADWEAHLINENVRKFNGCLESLVEAEATVNDNIHYVSVLEGEHSFSGHEAYTDTSFLTGVMLVQSEDLNLRSPISSYSFHPNEKGLEAYRDAVQEKIKELEDERPLVAYLDDNGPDPDASYAAYAAKLEEYIERYGGPRKVTGGSTWSVSGDGVCLAELVDFDGDGIEELYVAYYNPDNESQEYSWTGHDANAYVIEVWSYVDGSVHVAYQGQASSSQQGLAYCSRAIFNAGDGGGNATSWVHYSGYAEGNYTSSLWSINGATSSLEHKWELVDEFTADSKWLLDGEETDQNESEWSDTLRAEWRNYSLMDFTPGEGVDACVDLTKETMHRLGIAVPTGSQNESESDVPDAQALFSATLDDLKVQARANDFFDGLFYQFADLDGDGVDELFVSYLSGSWSETTNLIYKLQDGEVVRIFEYVRRGGGFVRCYPQTGTVVVQMTYKAMVYTWYYRYEDGVLVQRAAELDGRNYNGSLGYEGAEGVEVTGEEDRALVSGLENGDAIELSLESSW